MYHKLIPAGNSISAACTRASDFSRSHARIDITTILHDAPQLHYTRYILHTQYAPHLAEFSPENRNARAETIGSDGGPQTRKPVPGGAVGLANTEKSTQDLFRVTMVRVEGAAGAGGGGDRDRDAAVGTPDGGALPATRPAPGATAQPDPAAAAGNRAVRGPASTDACHGTTPEGAYTDGTFDEPQDLTQVTRPPADAPARRTVPKQKPDATSKHPIKPTMANYVPRQMREKLDQIPVADQTARSPEYKKRPRPS